MRRAAPGPRNAVLVGGLRQGLGVHCAGMAKARTKAAPVSRFDGEALGLALFALGIFIGVTVSTPPEAGGVGVMSQIRAVLVGQLGWGAYLIAVVPVAYGVLVFLGRDLGNLTR